MQEPYQTISQREVYTPSRWQQLLWWLATAEKTLISTCVIDRNRYAIIGMTVMGTWLFATIAWTYFFTTVTGSLLLSALLGIFMGAIILTIDRALIKGINRNNKRKIIPLLFRGVLALTIGLFMAQPALLYLFNKDIKVQVSLDNEQRKRNKRMQQDTANASAKTILLTEKNKLEQQLATSYQEVSEARENFIAETDGTGGSKKVGLKNIALAKQNEYQKLDAAYTQLAAALQPRIRIIDSTLLETENSIRREQAAFESLLNDGFITRIEALNNLVGNNTAVAFRYYLLVAILLLIELMPVIAKSMLPNGSYDEKVRLREEIEKTLTQHNHERELALQELYNQTAFEKDSQFIQTFFDKANAARYQEMETAMAAWKGKEDTRFDALWEKMKTDMLSKQEG